MESPLPHATPKQYIKALGHGCNVGPGRARCQPVLHPRITGEIWPRLGVLDLLLLLLLVLETLVCGKQGKGVKCVHLTLTDKVYLASTWC